MSAQFIKEMKLARSILALFATVCCFWGVPVSRAAVGGLSLPSSHEIAPTTPGVSSQPRPSGIRGWDSNPWVPATAVLVTIAAGPLIRRNLSE